MQDKEFAAAVAEAEWLRDNKSQVDAAFEAAKSGRLEDSVALNELLKKSPGAAPC